MVLEHEFPSDTRVENEIESLINGGHEVYIACYTLKGLQRNDKYLNSVIYRLPLSKLAYKTSVGALKFPFYFCIWRSFLKKILKDIVFDAIHVHDLPLAKIGYELSLENKCKFVLDLHENWPALLEIAPHTKSILGRYLSNTTRWKEYEVKYCNLADKIIVVVDEARERLIKLGINSSKISVVSNTLNTNQFQISDHCPDPNLITLLYAGGVSKHRGLQYVIKGLKYLKKAEKQIRLKIVGDGAFLNNLKELSIIENVESMVEFTGWKTHDEMFNFVGSADICLIPHEKNDHTDTTIPHKIFQYMYASKPIVASNCHPLERILTESNGGLIYKFNKPKEFSLCIKELISNPDLYKSMAKSANDSVRQKYLWERDGEILNQIYSG